MNYDETQAFLNWWLQNRPMAPPIEGFHTCNGQIQGSVIYRSGQYQVQMFVVQPNSVIAPHIHPNVDSYEVYVSGDVEFMLNGEVYSQANNASGILRVAPDSWHGGTFGPKGGVFLSAQRWLNGVPPTSVGEDWKDELGRTQGAAESLNGSC